MKRAVSFSHSPDPWNERNLSSQSAKKAEAVLGQVICAHCHLINLIKRLLLLDTKNVTLRVSPRKVHGLTRW